MGRGRLSRHEISGLLFLVLLIAVITGISLALNQCGTEPPAAPQPLIVEMRDTLREESDKKDSVEKKESRKEKKETGDTPRKERGTKKDKEKKKAAPQAIRKDPFGDTVPTDI